MHRLPLLVSLVSFVMLAIFPPLLAGQQSDVLRRAQQAAQKADWSTVRSITAGDHGTGPEAAAIYLMSSYAELSTSRFDAAAERSALAIEADSTLFQAWLLHGEALMSAGREQQSVTVFEQCVARFPDSARATYALGIAYARTGQCEAAITPLEETMFKRPENLGVVAQLAECYLLVQRYAEASDLYGRLYELTPNDDRLRVSFVECLMRQEKYDSVIAILKPRVAAHPNDTTSLTAIGYAYQQTKQFPEAVDALSSVTELTPKNADAWYNLGSAQYNADDRQAAIRSFKRAARENPRMGQAWFNMALAYSDDGFAEEAIRAFKRAAVLVPEKAADCYMSIAVINRELGHLDAALKANERAITLGKDDVRMYASNGYTLLAAERFAEGRDFLLKSLERFPNDPEILYPLAKCYIRLGEAKKAEEIADDLDERAPVYGSELRMMMRN